MSLGGTGGDGRSVNASFRWLVSASAISLLIGSALLLWGLKVVPVSNPFNSFVRDSPGEAEKRPGPVKREHPWAVTLGTVLSLMGLALLVVAGIARR
jgi:hypothetical protein